MPARARKALTGKPEHAGARLVFLHAAGAGGL